MTFSLGERSRSNLVGVHPDLVKVVHVAIDLSECDFSVFEGLRSKARQKQLVESGASRTLDSRHITGHAVDLVPWVGKALRWDWPLCHKIALSVLKASNRLNIQVVWGGAWDRWLSEIPATTADDMEDAAHAYAARMRAEGKRPFLDGPHFELPRSLYLPLQVETTT